MKTLAAFLLLVSAAVAAPPVVDYPIAYCAAEHPTASMRVLPEVGHPFPAVESRLMLREASGAIKLLVGAGSGSAVFDARMSLDGKSIYYAQIDDVKLLGNRGRPASGSEIWRYDFATGAKTKLTDQTAFPYHGRTRAAGDGILNMGPCEVPGGMILFTSDREIHKQDQLWAMDLDGKNVQKVGYENVAGAQGPVILSDGRVLWSSLESQGDRKPINWGLWTTWPDGRNFNPFFSAFVDAASIHFHNEAGNHEVVTGSYYQVSNQGMGFYRAAPLNSGFEHRIDVSKPPVYEGTRGMKIFARIGEYNLTPWTHGEDQAAPLVDKTLPWGDTTGERVGKVTHPSPTPSPDWMLTTYSPGPVSLRGIPTDMPPVQSGIYLIPIGKPTAGPQDLIKVIDDPNVNEFEAVAVVPYSRMFGSDPPEIPWLPNDGTKHPSLPAGTPYALIGSGSMYARETDALMHDGSGVPQPQIQGGNALPFKNSQIHAIRILTAEWHTGSGNARYRSGLNGDERLRILGEIPVRKFDGVGNPILDMHGNPDTSFLALVRADEPFTFQLIDKDGKSLTTAKTWHHVRPGETKWDCSGCHEHTGSTKQTVSFEQSAAFSRPPVDLTKAVPRLIEYNRDVLPILTKHGCVDCHTTGLEGVPVLAFSPKSDDSFSYRRASLPIWKIYDSLHSKIIERISTADPTLRMPRGGEPVTAAEIRTIAEWIDTGAGNDLGSGEFQRDDTKPTLFIHSPRMKTQPVTRVVVSAADAWLDESSLKVTLNGQPVVMTSGAGGIWSATVPETASGELTAEVKDQAGNVTRMVRTFTPGSAIPPPPPPPDDELARLRAEVEALKAKIQKAIQDLMN